MDTVTTKLQREPGEHRKILLRIPLELLEQAGIEPWADVVMRVEGTRLVVEALQQDTDLMDMYAEEFVAGYAGELRALGDDACRPTD
jgi:hypothetical protein